MSLGPAEILVIAVLALLVFGPKRLPEVSRQIGGALREIRKVQSTVRSEINDVLAEPAPERPIDEVAAANRDAATDNTIEPDIDHPEPTPLPSSESPAEGADDRPDDGS